MVLYQPALCDVIIGTKALPKTTKWLFVLWPKKKNKTFFWKSDNENAESQISNFPGKLFGWLSMQDLLLDKKQKLK